jgi:hypothetical protein
MASALFVSRPQVRATFFTEKGNLNVSADLHDTTKSDQIVSISTHKDLGQAAGTWSVEMTAEGYGDSGGWKNILRLGDLVVIEMGPDRPQPANTWYVHNHTEGLGGQAEIVMIGTVDDIGFSSRISPDGKPEQRVTIKGRDMGKYLIDDMIMFQPWHEPVKALLKWKDVFVEFPKVGFPGTPASIFDVVLQKWIYDQFDVQFDVTTRGPVTALGQRKLSQILRYVVDADTPILPYSQNLMTFEGSPWNMMEQVVNRPWYLMHLDCRRKQDIELLTSHTNPGKVVDSATNPGAGDKKATTTWNTSLGRFNTQVALMYYRTPFSNRHYDDWTELPTRVITDDDIIGLEVWCSVEEVVNRWQVLAAWPGLNRTLGAESAQREQAPELERRYGFRPRVLKNVFAFDSRDPAGNLISERFTELARDFDLFNSVFLNGQITIKGMAQVKVGDRLHYRTGDSGGVDFYVESVRQEFVALTSWRTTLAVTRGQVHRDRGQKLFDAKGQALMDPSAISRIG